MKTLSDPDVAAIPAPSLAMVTIVLPTYNRASRLPGALRSCLQQTYRNLEVIVVDDGSTDNTAEVVASFQREDPRVRYLRQQNQKLPAALNAGFRASKGDLLTWISDDNRFHQDAIEIMAGFLENNPDVGLMYCGYDIVDAQGNLLQIVDPPGPESIFNLNCVQACFMYRRKVYEVIGDYNPAWQYVEDYDYWLRIQKRFKLARLPNVHPYTWAIHHQSLTFKLGPRQKALAARVRMSHASPWKRKWRIFAETREEIGESWAEQANWGRAFVAGLQLIVAEPWRIRRWVRALQIFRFALSRRKRRLPDVNLKLASELGFWQRWTHEHGIEPDTEYYRRFMLAMGNLEDASLFGGKICLDIGCGPKGSLTWLTNAAAAIGLDPLAESYVRFGIQRHKMVYLQARAEQIPLPSHYVDVVFSMNSLDHVDQLDEACKEIRRILKPGGYFIGSLNLNEPPTPTEPWTLSAEYLEKHLFASWERQFYKIRPKLNDPGHFGPYKYFFEEPPAELLTHNGPQALWCRFRVPQKVKT
jgi:glycosyltransferase involved in cell wall biosynthesis/ubiquinone/menaquinone biosynthesis C-methylase UbiE